jgi:cardiolipin synthase
LSEATRPQNGAVAAVSNEPVAYSKALSIPNLLTYSRIAAAPAIAAAAYLPDDWAYWVPFALFVIASITDFFDGYLARAWSQQSALGRMLDPIADKLLVAVCLIVLVAHDTIAGASLWAAVIILMREILVSGLREFLAEVKVSVPVTRLAKWKTTAQLIAIAVLLVGPAAESLLPGATAAGLTLLWLSAIVTLYTGFDYVRAGLVHLLSQD